MNAAVPIVLQGPGGETVIAPSALDFAARVERNPPDPTLHLSAALRASLAELIAGAGGHADDDAITAAVRDLQNLRRGQAIDRIDVPATVPPATIHPLQSMRPRATPPPAPRLQHFAAVRTYPDPSARAIYDGLVGLDDHKLSLLDELELLLYPDRVRAWGERHHGTGLRVVDTLAHRVPLVVFHGDVGTGKTALAESVGDALVERVGRGRSSAHLLKMSTAVRGQGLVGQMSDLIGAAFKEAVSYAEAHRGDPVIVLLDEADALASSREGDQMHHEDRGGVNTLIQQLDNLRLSDLRIAAFFITNRRGALDPAVRRRAALDLAFDRPDDRVRRAIFEDRLPELGLSGADLDVLVRLTGPQGDGNDGVAFTASDIADRLMGTSLRAAYAADAALSYGILAEAARRLDPTPLFNDRP